MKKNSLKSYLVLISVAVLLAVLTRVFLVTAYKVPTGSMQPTLKPGDFIFATKVSYGLSKMNSGWILRWKSPQRNEVVVFTYPDQPGVKYVKRVVALAGDEVKIENDRLWINGQKMDYAELPDQSDSPNRENFVVQQESHSTHSHSIIVLKSSKSKTFGPLKVPEGQVFLLGDNRDASDDSRNWGTVPMENVLARVQWIWLSLDWQKKWAQNRLPQVRWSRIFSSVH